MRHNTDAWIANMIADTIATPPIADWLAAHESHDMHDMQTTPTVLVTVAAVEGSGPRETGAKMLVSETAQCDTIGGGHLEMRACEIAREMLAARAASVPDPMPRRLERFALGPGLGQCCGGVVHLAFEGMDRHALDSMAMLRRRRQAREDSWRLISLDDTTPAALLDRSGNRLIGTVPYPPLDINVERPCHVMRDRSGRRWLVDPCLAYRPHLVLFGAGHVGAAIVRALAELPCRITWVDEREELFPHMLPANVQVEATDTPEFIADAAPAGSSFLVLTHSHALDLRLSEHILRRAGNDWFGLIGSTTKRRQFEHRLAERGIATQRLNDMACPIGLPGILGKAPAIIAASVAAQLLQVWETAEQAVQRAPQRQVAAQMLASA
jgi:xanthine dehydrogenase accessory factor